VKLGDFLLQKASGHTFSKGYPPDWKSNKSFQPQLATEFFLSLCDDSQKKTEWPTSIALYNSLGNKKLDNDELLPIVACLDSNNSNFSLTRNMHKRLFEYKERNQAVQT